MRRRWVAGFIARYFRLDPQTDFQPENGYIWVGIQPRYPKCWTCDGRIAKATTASILGHTLISITEICVDRVSNRAWKRKRKRKTGLLVRVAIR